jgi:TetR/AcrR family transcriptional regulator, regulator of cefoperazone and chloramphenicol sensitivity
MELKPSKEATGAARQTLVRAALRLFGEQGYDGTSTREIAAAANANIGSIAYHFGGKEGLHRACGEAVAAMILAAAGPALNSSDSLAGMPREMARAMIPALFRRFAAFLLSSPESEIVVPFILREMAHPGAAFDAIYSGVLEPAHSRLCMIWEAATGEAAQDETTKLTVFSMMGQLVYFRVGAAAVARRLGKTALGAAEVEAILAVIGRNLDARLNAPAAGGQS